MSRKKNTIFLMLPFLTMVLLFFIVPMIYMLISSFTSASTGITVEHYKNALTDSYILQGFKNSITLSLLSAFIALIVSLLSVYTIMRFSESLREKILILSNLTSTFSGVPLAFAFIILLGNSGLFTLLFKKWGVDFSSSFSLYSWSGLLLVYIYFQLPLALMLLYPIYYGIQDRWKEAASLLGASPFVFWWKIGIPILLPGIAGTFSVLFANAMGAYASAYALTASSYNLASIKIGSLIKGDIFAQPEFACAIAVLLGATMVSAMLLNEWFIKKSRKDLAQP